MRRSRIKGAACALLIMSMTVGVGMPAITGQTAERTTVKIGTESLVELPQAALWSGVVNFRPGDGEIVKLNPPRFSWSYTPDPAKADADIEAKQFVFQIAYEPGFTNPVVNLQTVSNMYNLLAPLTQKTVYWRVGYIHDGAT